jgi:signal transduction histidine kinase
MRVLPMRKSWKDQWKPGTKEREAFEDIDAIVALMQRELDELRATSDELRARIVVLET